MTTPPPPQQPSLRASEPSAPALAASEPSTPALAATVPSTPTSATGYIFTQIPPVSTPTGVAADPYGTIVNKIFSASSSVQYNVPTLKNKDFINYDKYWRKEKDMSNLEKLKGELDNFAPTDQIKIISNVKYNIPSLHLQGTIGSNNLVQLLPIDSYWQDWSLKNIVPELSPVGLNLIKEILSKIILIANSNPLVLNPGLQSNDLNASVASSSSSSPQQTNWAMLPRGFQGGNNNMAHWVHHMRKQAEQSKVRKHKGHWMVGGRFSLLQKYGIKHDIPQHGGHINMDQYSGYTSNTCGSEFFKKIFNRYVDILLKSYNKRLSDDTTKKIEALLLTLKDTEANLFKQFIGLQMVVEHGLPSGYNSGYDAKTPNPDVLSEEDLGIRTNLLFSKYAKDVTKMAAVVEGLQKATGMKDISLNATNVLGL